MIDSFSLLLSPTSTLPNTHIISNYTIDNPLMQIMAFPDRVTFSQDYLGVSVIKSAHLFPFLNL